ncbi:MAG: hypothetical protein IPM26_03020 [Saprospiraceae bacterium]|nr:hypothetical protein [Saprospiraceae bacterium]
MDFSQLVLLCHIISGASALLTGTINIVRKKGGRLHSQVGMIFFWSMILTSVFAIMLATLRPNPFLLLIGIFSLYLTVSGQRMIRYQEYQSKLSQKILHGVSALAATGLIIYSIYLLMNLKSFGLVPLTFGLIMLTLIRQEILLKNISFAKRVKLHIGRITGAYIAALTAFLVVNNTFLPGWLAWMLPTAIIVPLILRWSKLYEDKKADTQT